MGNERRKSTISTTLDQEFTKPSHFTQFFENYGGFIRLCLQCVTVVGSTVWLIYSPNLRQYTAANQLVVRHRSRRRRKYKGLVVRIDKHNILKVRHLPTLPIHRLPIIRDRYKPVEDDSLLTVALAGIDPASFLQSPRSHNSSAALDRVKGMWIRFVPVYIDRSGNTAFCFIYCRKWYLLSSCSNVDIIRLGLAAIDPRQSTDTPPQSLANQPQQSLANQPQQSLGNPPHQSLANQPQQSLANQPQQSLGDPPHQSLGDPPQQSLAIPTQQSLAIPPQQSLANPPQQSLGDPPQQSLADPSQKSRVDPLQQSLVYPTLDYLFDPYAKDMLFRLKVNQKYAIESGLGIWKNEDNMGDGTLVKRTGGTLAKVLAALLHNFISE